jgi:hypothetical protein
MYFVSIAHVWNFQIIMNIKHWKRNLEKIKEYAWKFFNDVILLKKKALIEVFSRRCNWWNFKNKI